jgi:AcrR family transcriptional regulator
MRTGRGRGPRVAGGRSAANRPRARGRAAEREDAPRHAGRPVGATGDRTRERLIQKGLQTFAELGFAGASVRDIARKARIRVSSLYHYFSSKEALYQAVQDRVQEQLRELMLGVMGQGLDLRGMAREAVGRLFDFFLANPAYVQLGYRAHLEGAGATESFRRVTDRWLGLMEGLMKPAELQGVLKPVDPALFLVTVDALVHWHTASDAFYRGFLGKGLDDPEIARRVRDHLIQMVLRMVGLE